MGEPKVKPKSKSLSDERSHHSLLKGSVLFTDINEKILDQILPLFEVVNFVKGEPIILENEISDYVYFVKSGAVEIVSYVPELKQLNRLAILHEGDQFSEFSVLNHSTTSGSAFALEDCELLRIKGENFMAVLHKLPVIAKSLAINLARLNKSVVESRIFIEHFRKDLIQVNPKIPQILPIPTWERFGVLPLKFEAGILTVALKNPNNSRFYDFLKAHAPKTSVNVFLISKSDFSMAHEQMTQYYSGQAQNISLTHKESEQIESLESLIHNNPLFVGLDDSIVTQIVPHFKKVNFDIGDVIFEPGSESEDFYLIETGKVEISYPLRGSQAGTHMVTLGPGGGFGELSLITNDSHKHLAVASETTSVYTLNKKVFTELMKTSTFSIPLAQNLAARLKFFNHLVGLKFFERQKDVDLTQFHNLIPVNVLEKYRIMPLILDEEELTLGIVNPESEEIYSVVARYLMDFRIAFEMISDEDLEKWILQMKNQSMNPSRPGLPRVQSLKIARVEPKEEFDAIVLEGFQSRASDIHLEPSKDYFGIRFRIDGVLKERESTISLEQGREIIRRLKVVSELDISNERTPQDGQFKLEIKDQQIIARASILPTKRGEKAVLRVIQANSGVVPLKMLAPDRRVIKILKSVADSSHGLFLVTGPTGSGKSTTLYSLLNEINDIGVNIMTLEDPVEKEIPGISQVQLNTKLGLTFPNALRSFLRQDPDVIMVGEIRDSESAKIVFEAAVTGHLVLSTLHTRDSLDIAPRLSEIGVSPMTIATALLGSVSQRLVRANCQHCLEERPMTPFESQFFLDFLPHQKAPETLKEGKGCEKCNGIGYFGRIPVFEIWQTNDKIQQILSKEQMWSQMKAVAQEDGFETLIEFALRMVTNNLTSMNEIRRCLI